MTVRLTIYLASGEKIVTRGEWLGYSEEDIAAEIESILEGENGKAGWRILEDVVLHSTGVHAVEVDPY